jgi:pimeloyl-ACP methyl ester carboxylesterase
MEVIIDMPMLDLNGSSLYYSVIGKGIPIVFIHPPLLTNSNFYYQKRELFREFQVITFDIRGHGNSQNSKIPITYNLIVADILCLLDHLKINKAVICGYSTGGSIVLEYLINASERALGGIIISGMSEVRDNLKDKISLGVTFANIEDFPILALAISWGNSNTKAMFNKLFQDALKGNPENIKQYYLYSLHYNCTDNLEKIELPVLLVYGKKDRQFSYYADLLQEKLPYTELKYIDNVKHQIPTKASYDVNNLIKRFIFAHNKTNIGETYL